MRLRLAELVEFHRIAIEALGRYPLRTFLSVLGIVLGVAAVIAMMSVTEGAAREALSQVEALGIDNLVARSTGGVDDDGKIRQPLTAADAERALQLVPSARFTSPLVVRYVRVSHGSIVDTAPLLGVRPAYRDILGISIERGRFLSVVDEERATTVCVLGAHLAQELFGFRDPLGQDIRAFGNLYTVVGVLREHGTAPGTGSSLAWHDVNSAAFVPLASLTGRALTLDPAQPVDEIWLRIANPERTADLGIVFGHALTFSHDAGDFRIVVPRELLAQRYRTQRTFGVVIGSVAVLSLLVGGIGIMNIMLTSVVERTKEIGVRRTAGAPRRAVRLQFLIEALLMTIGGGIVGILLGCGVALAISTFAGWATYVSPAAIGLALVVSLAIGLGFGTYPAMKAASLNPVDAMRYE
ncbi:MAG: ABC transporter permease [Vicinamibacterales bacterium]